MADCSKTLEFLRELRRMCNSFYNCAGCGLSRASRPAGRDLFCKDYVETFPEDAIAIVQKWSDENPEMTWIGKLREVLPNADTTRLLTTTCPWTIFGGKAPGAGDCSKGIDDCARCWNSEYKSD